MYMDSQYIFNKCNKIGKAVSELGNMVKLSDENIELINKHNALLKEIYEGLSLIQQLELIQNEDLEFTVSHSLLYGLIYVYDVHDSIAFMINEQEFNELTGLDVDKLDNEEIKVQIYTHYKEELNAHCSE